MWQDNLPLKCVQNKTQCINCYVEVYHKGAFLSKSRTCSAVTLLLLKGIKGKPVVPLYCVTQ